MKSASSGKRRWFTKPHRWSWAERDPQLELPLEDDMDESTPMTPADETRGIAVVGMALSFGLIGVLKKNGLLDSVAVENAFDGALGAVEGRFAPDDPAGQIARQMLEAMAMVAAGQLPKGLGA